MVNMHTVDIAGILNEGSSSVSSAKTWEFFSDADNTTWNLGDITQKSSLVNLFLRKRAANTGLFLNIDSVFVSAGTLRFGNTYANTAVTSVNISGTTMVEGGNILVV